VHGLGFDRFGESRSTSLEHDPPLSRGQAFSDLPSPAEASTQTTDSAKGFAQAGNRYPPRIKCGAGFFGIMLYDSAETLRPRPLFN
jgi:hypothetical protein